MSKSKDWFNFQEDIAEHFRSLGVHAETNKTIKGIRTEHDIDVYVSSKYLCTDIKWVIEAKYWKSKVSKEKVLALRTIVDDIGADKGFIISQAGFQSGAYEASENSNIDLFTYEQLLESTSFEVHGLILNTFSQRVRLLELRYYSHSKINRIKYKLRNDLLEYPIQFSGNLLINILFDAIDEGKKLNYPIFFPQYMIDRMGEQKAENFAELINWLNLNLNWFDEKILTAEYQMIKNNDFAPDIVEVNVNKHSIYELALEIKGLSFEEKIKIFNNSLE